MVAVPSINVEWAASVRTIEEKSGSWLGRAVVESHDWGMNKLAIVVAGLLAMSGYVTFKQMSRQQVNGLVDEDFICQAAISVLMARDVQSMRVVTSSLEGKEVRVSFQRKEREVIMECRIEGQRVHWRFDGDRWRDQPTDGEVEYVWLDETRDSVAILERYQPGWRLRQVVLRIGL